MIWIVYILKLVSSACLYSDYDQFQLNSNNFFQEKNYKRGNQYAFGVWTQYAPLRKNSYTHKSNFDSSRSLDGFHILNFQNEGNIQTLFYQQPIYVTTYPTLRILQNTVTGVYLYKIQEDLLYYEGYWIFTYFSFNYDNKYNFASYNTGDGRFFNFLVTNRKLKSQSTNAKLEYGGQGLYNIQGNNFNLNIFLGRISIITIFENSIIFFNNYDQAKFVDFISKCSVPQECQNVVELKFINEPYDQYNCTIRDYQVDIKGQIQMIDFWMKRDPYKINSEIELILSLGGLFSSLEQYYQFKLLWRVVNQDVILLHSIGVYYVVPGEKITQYSFYIDAQLLKPIKNFEQWTYLKYQFEKFDIYQYVYLQMYQSCCDSWESFYVLDISYYQVYTNYQATITLFTEFVTPTVIPFQGQISNFRFKQCSDFDYDFESNLNCNALCKTCQGPTQYDCISCYNEQNRYLQQELHQCLCKTNYQESNSLICQKTYLSSISQKIELYQEYKIIEMEHYKRCSYYHFEVWKDLKFIGCIKCPYFGQNHNQLHCVNCILNSHNWYLEPKCNFDYRSDDSVSYYNQQLDYQQQEIFIINIDKMDIELCFGCEQTTETINQFSIIQNVNGLNQFYQCKQSLYPNNNICELCQTNCIKCKDTTNCVECNQGFYVRNDYCHECPQGCLSCNLDTDLDQIKCFDCQQSYSLVNNNCRKCGQLCSICTQKINQNTGQEYMKCLKCDQNTYISLDGESCYYNNLDHCIYPFQYSIVSNSINTVIYDFQPEESQYIKTGCTYCSPISYLNIEQNNYICKPFDFDSNPFGCYQSVYHNGNYICTLGINHLMNLGIGYCTQLIPHCLVCFSYNWEYANLCSICEDGYYNDYYTSFCKPCNPECASCIQVDSSKIIKFQPILLFTHLKIFRGVANFRLLCQNPNENEIEMICTKCSDGYVQYFNKCILKCPNNCKECKIINEQQVCLSCIQFNDSHYQLYNGKCIQCPLNCNICHPRTEKEKQSLNPYFNNKDLEYFSHQCIQSFSNDDLYYDQDIQQFIKCDNIIECQKQIIIEVYIYCNQNDLDNYFNLLNDEQKVIQTKFHVLLDNLDLTQYEYYDYFLYLNQHFIKIFTYQLKFVDNQVCSLNKELNIKSNLQTNCFNLIELNLIISGSQNTLYLNNHLSILGFQNIRIENLNLQIFNGHISMDNIYGYNVQLENINIQQDQNDFISQNYLIQIKESSKINISKLQINNINVDFLNGLLLISNQNIDIKIIAIDLIIKYTKIMDTQIINFNTSKNVQMNISNFYIQNSQFTNTTVMNLYSQTKILNINNFIIENSIIINTRSFLDFEQIQKVELNKFQFENSILQNSNLISSSTILLLIEFNFQQLQLIEQSTLLINQQTRFIEIIQIQNGKIIDNVYSNKHALILILNCEIVQLTNLILINNSININNQKDSFAKNIELSIINIQSNAVIFDTLNIQRGIGYSEFTIKNSNTFKLINSVITLHQNYYFKSLFNNQECNFHPFNQYMYNNLMNLQNSSYIQMQNTNITNIILYDSVLFEIQTLSQINSQFIMINCNFYSNILHQLNKYQKVSLISINSNSYLNLNITNVIFSQNLLNLLRESNPQKQSLILLVEAFQAQTTISNCIIQKNMNLNGQGSILYIDSDIIILENTQFLSNSAFTYDTLKQFLRWGLTENIFLEHLQQLYTIQSNGGNGNLQGRQIIFNNILLQDSISKQGAAFVLKMIENGNILIKNSNFQNLKAELVESSQGGAFHIQSQSLYLTINVIDTKFLNISSRKGGSIMYILPSTKLFLITLFNSTFDNILSIQGGIIYIEKSTHQEIIVKMNKCYLSQNLDTFYQFINSLPDVLNNELNTLTQEYSLIYCLDCQYKISDLSVTNYLPIPLFQFYGSVNLMNISIQNIIFSNPLILFNPVRETDQIIIHNIEFYNCTQILITEIDIPKQQQQNIFNNNSILSTSCNLSLIDAPQTVISFNQTYTNINQITFLEIILTQIQQSIEAMIFFQLVDYYQRQTIKLSNINLINNKCSNCSNGLLNFQNSKSKSILIEKIAIYNSYCGKNGCLSFISQDKRILQSQDYIYNSMIRIINLECINNFAQYGGCLFVQDQIIQINQSLINGNKAIMGGAIYTKGINSTLISENVIITNNSAQFGSGIYNQDNLKRNVKGIDLIENQGFNQIDEKPQEIYLQIFRDEIMKPTIVSISKKHKKSQILSKNGQISIIHLPTGIPLSKYRKFEMEKNKYNEKTIEMRLFAVNSQQEIVRNLTNTYCILNIININNQFGQTQNLQLNTKKIYFNSSTFSYNLDDLIFYIPSDSNQTFEFTIQCNSIYIPIFNNNSNLIEGYHQNYTLSLLIKPNECQMGEFSQSREDYCHQCIIDQKQYSVIIGAINCQIVDDQKIQEITQAQIYLKKGYWRMKVTSSIIDLCLKREGSCIGGWGVGNDLCEQGYIGALCEQCDYYNIRGGGNYQREGFYNCQVCESDDLNQQINFVITILIFVCLIVYINYLSKKRIEFIRSNIKEFRIPFFRQVFFKQKEVLMGQSIKIILFYFQIISYTQELTSVFSDQIQQLIHYFGDPFTLLGIFKECELLNLEVSVIYIQILQNLACLIIIITIFLCFCFAKILILKFKITQMEFFNFVYLIYIFVFGSVIRSTIQLIAFRKISDFYWIYKNISYLYSSKDHLILVFFLFLPIVISLGIVLPLLLIQKLKSPLFLSKRIPFKDFGFWFTSYSKNHQQWEFYKFFLVYGLISIIIMVDANDTIKGVLSYSLLIIYTKVFQDNNIYYNKQMNTFENQLNIISIIILISCTLFSIEVNQGLILGNVIFYFINSLFVLSGIFMILHLIKLNYQYIKRMFCKMFEKLGKFNQIFNQYNIFQAHSKTSIEIRQKRFEKLKAFLRQQSQTQLLIKKESYNSEENTKTYRF